MDITPYIEGLRRDLAAAADAGGQEARQSAERLALALDPAMRMALFDALSQAAAEITQELAAGSVEVRLKGREPQFVVDVPAPAEPAPTAAEDAEEDSDEAEGPVARITLRIPESLKQRAEDAASKRGQSLNTWLVAAVRTATRERAINVDIDLSSLPFGEGWPGGGPRRGRRPGPGGKRISGWVR
jgi:HicB family